MTFFFPRPCVCSSRRNTTLRLAVQPVSDLKDMRSQHCQNSAHKLSEIPLTDKESWLTAFARLPPAVLLFWWPQQTALPEQPWHWKNSQPLTHIVWVGNFPTVSAQLKEISKLGSASQISSSRQISVVHSHNWLENSLWHLLFPVLLSSS